jgi:hypothetical protein
VEVASNGTTNGGDRATDGEIKSNPTWATAGKSLVASPVWMTAKPCFCGLELPVVTTVAAPYAGIVKFCQEPAAAVPVAIEMGAPDAEKNESETTVGDGYGFSTEKVVATPAPSTRNGISVDWPPDTAVAAAATFTCTGMATDMPVPVTVTAPVYVPAAINDAVLQVTDKLAGLDWLTLRVLAESTIHDWLALAVSETAATNAVLN